MHKNRSEYQRQWRLAHPEYCRRKSREWRRKHPGSFRRKGETIEESRALWRAHSKEFRKRKIAKFLAGQRPLCLCGCGNQVLTPLAKYLKKHHPKCPSGQEYGTGKSASISPSVRQIEWAAGFLEGEGHFCRDQVGASQVQREPLDRLVALFGGRMREFKGGKFVAPDGSKAYVRQDYFRWYVSAPRARGVMMTVYSLMSPRRKKQIEMALDF